MMKMQNYVQARLSSYSRTHKILWTAGFLVIGLMSSCSKGVSNDPSGVPPGPPAVSVRVTPTEASVTTNTTQQFVAVVENSSSSAVTWKVDGVQGGNASLGRISSAGLYSAPTSVGTHTITATSVATPSSSASVTATVTLPRTIVRVTPANASITMNATQQFSAVVENNTNPAVTWSVDGVQGGNASVGRISSAGLYTAPASAGTHTITAASVAAPASSASATVTVTAIPVVVRVTPTDASITANASNSL